jgi:outer membrane protein OmpA-like peptidoglycan-associated protein
VTPSGAAADHALAGEGADPEEAGTGTARASGEGGSSGMDDRGAPEADDTAASVSGDETPALLSLSPDADALHRALIETGHVAVPGLLFESGTSALLPPAERAIAAMRALLEAEPEVSLRVVGHSDDVGDLDVNRALSLARAERVVAALIEAGIAPGRLEAHGVGPLAPIATNRTEEGRALNRRVELVLR